MLFRSAERAAQLNPLQSLAGIGQTAANALTGAAGQYGSNVGNLYMQQGVNAGNAALVRGSAYGNALAGIGQLYGRTNPNWNNLFGSPTVVPNTVPLETERNW